MAKLWAEPALAAVKDRVMPPWLVTDDGSCQTFEESLWMSDAEIAMFEAWVEDGLVMGEDVSALGSEDDDALSEDALELIMSDVYVPRAEPDRGYAEDDYRCFVLDPGQDRDRFITGFEVEAGDPTQVHHVLVYDIDPEMIVGGGPMGPITNGQVIESLSTDVDRIGYSCFGAAGEGVVPSGLPVAWAPGVRVTRYPEGTGLFLRQGHLLVMQIHYHLHDEDRPDRTKIRLELVDQVEKPGFVLLPDGFLSTAFGPTPATLPPGMSDVPYTWQIPAQAAIDEIRAATGLPNAKLSLQGAVPHMHGHGKSMQVGLTRGGAKTCVADVFRWDYDWQRFYFYADPIEIEDDHLLETTCHFDTSNETEPIHPGLGSNDEMCLFGIYVVATP
jgi:hypothetical protein